MVKQYPYILQTRTNTENGFGEWVTHSVCRDDRKYSERNYAPDAKDLYKGVKVFLPLGSALPLLGIDARVMDGNTIRIEGRLTMVQKTQLNIEIAINE